MICLNFYFYDCKHIDKNEIEISIKERIYYLDYLKGVKFDNFLETLVFVHSNNI